eukprot:3941319-Rhodomonas_salina.2
MQCHVTVFPASCASGCGVPGHVLTVAVGVLRSSTGRSRKPECSPSPPTLISDSGVSVTGRCECAPAAECALLWSLRQKRRGWHTWHPGDCPGRRVPGSPADSQWKDSVEEGGRAGEREERVQASAHPPHHAQEPPSTKLPPRLCTDVMMPAEWKLRLWAGPAQRCNPISTWCHPDLRI